MRSKMVWRYWCDHCKKGGCSKGAMAKHELSCTRNPERKCRMCARAELPQQPMAVLIEAATSVEALREAASGCPACMLAGSVQAHPGPYTPCADDGFYDPRIWIDFKAEAETFWRELNAAEREAAPNYGY